MLIRGGDESSGIMGERVDRAYRIDSLCQEKLRLPAKVASALVARFKIMSNMDIAERAAVAWPPPIFAESQRIEIPAPLHVPSKPAHLCRISKDRALLMPHGEFPISQPLRACPAASAAFHLAHSPLFPQVLLRPTGGPTRMPTCLLPFAPFPVLQALPRAHAGG